MRDSLLAASVTEKDLPGETILDNSSSSPSALADDSLPQTESDKESEEKRAELIMSMMKSIDKKGKKKKSKQDSPEKSPGKKVKESKPRKSRKGRDSMNNEIDNETESTMDHSHNSSFVSLDDEPPQQIVNISKVEKISNVEVENDFETTLEKNSDSKDNAVRSNIRNAKSRKSHESVKSKKDVKVRNVRSRRTRASDDSINQLLDSPASVSDIDDSVIGIPKKESKSRIEEDESVIEIPKKESINAVADMDSNIGIPKKEAKNTVRDSDSVIGIPKKDSKIALADSDSIIGIPNKESISTKTDSHESNEDHIVANEKQPIITNEQADIVVKEPVSQSEKPKTPKTRKPRKRKIVETDPSGTTVAEKKDDTLSDTDKNTQNKTTSRRTRASDEIVNQLLYSPDQVAESKKDETFQDKTDNKTPVDKKSLDTIKDKNIEGDSVSTKKVEIKLKKVDIEIPKKRTRQSLSSESNIKQSVSSEVNANVSSETNDVNKTPDTEVKRSSRRTRLSSGIDKSEPTSSNVPSDINKSVSDAVPKVHRSANDDEEITIIEETTNSNLDDSKKSPNKRGRKPGSKNKPRAAKVISP